MIYGWHSGAVEPPEPADTARLGGRDGVPETDPSPARIDPRRPSNQRGW